MSYEFINKKVLTRTLEYSVSYHCNLRCSNCAHLSPYSKKYFPSVESFTADINRLGKGLHANVINLLGGEPLLNPEINSYIKAAKESKIADTVKVVTNGLLLHKMDDDFWENVDVVSVSLYPEAPLHEKSIPIIIKRAGESNTQLIFSPTPLFRAMVVTEPHPRDWTTGMIFKTCKDVHLLHCHMVHEGKLYKCYVPPFLKEYLSKLKRDDYDPMVDAFDIHSSSDIYDDVKAYLTSGTAMDACRFCVGYVGKFEEHRQLQTKHIAEPGLLSVKRSTHLDKYRFLKHCAYYYYRKVSKK